MRNMTPAFLILTTVLMLSACTTTTARVEEAERQFVAETCEVWKPISYDSVHDTPLTIDDIQANNRARDAYCEDTEGED